MLDLSIVWIVMIIYVDHDSKKFQNYHLFLDDVRFPHQVEKALTKNGWDFFPKDKDWIIVRSYSEFTDCISKNEKLLSISFDHDLSTEHYPTGELIIAPINYEKYEEKTGYDCAKWLIEYCMRTSQPLPEFYVHSFNPVGRVNIFNILTKYNEISSQE